jgi:CRP/FNR family transcriptional regulator, cyclic AMP receptor protein
MDPVTERTLTTGWLAQADPALRKALLEAGRIRHFADGATIYTFDQHQICLWGVVSGLVRISIAMNEQEPKLAHCAGPGFWFGEVPIITGRTRAVQAVASGETRLCAIDRADIVAMARPDTEVWRLVATLSVLNQLVAIGAGEDLMIRDPRKRLVTVLLRLSGRRNAFQGTAPIPTVPVTQAELAEASTLSRSSATLILKDLVQLGMIRTDYRSIAILDSTGLEGLLVD